MKGYQPITKSSLLDIASYGFLYALFKPKGTHTVSNLTMASCLHKHNYILELIGIVVIAGVYYYVSRKKK